MFDDDPPSQKDSGFPKNLEHMSVAELQDYIEELNEEIRKVQSDIEKKQASQAAASDVFKI